MPIDPAPHVVGRHSSKTTLNANWAAVAAVWPTVSSGGVTGTFLGAVTGSLPAYRAIVGADLPNPSPTSFGGVFSLAATANSVLSGIGVDGLPTRATTTGTGSVVRQDTPNITGTATSNGQPYILHDLGSATTTIYSAVNGVRWVNASGSAVIGTLSNTGVRGFPGTSSGTTTVQSSAVASGVLTLPDETGTLLATTAAKSVLLGFSATINFNAVTDHPIPIALPPGFTRYRIQGINTINTGAASTLTTAQYGVFTSPGGAGTVIVASGSALSSLTSNAAATTTSLLVVGPVITAYYTNTTLYYRVTQAQGAAASGVATIQVMPLG